MSLYDGMTPLSVQLQSAFAQQVTCVQHVVLAEALSRVSKSVSKLVVYASVAPTITRTDVDSGETVVVALTGDADDGFVYRNPVWQDHYGIRGAESHRTILNAEAGSEVVFETVLVRDAGQARTEHVSQRFEPKELDLDFLLEDMTTPDSKRTVAGVTRCVLHPTTAVINGRDFVLGKTPRAATVIAVDTVVWSEDKIDACVLLVNGVRHVHITPAVSRAVRSGHVGSTRGDGRLEIYTGCFELSRLHGGLAVDIVPRSPLRAAFVGTLVGPNVAGCRAPE